MKPLALVLGFLILPVQTFYYMDCCCGDFCTHKNACTGCEGDQNKPCEVNPGHPPGGDCCPDQDHSTGTSKHESKKACAHLSPSFEVTVEAAEAAPPIPVVHLVLLLLPTVPEPLGTRDSWLKQVFRTGSKIPRHLLLSVLLI